MDKEEVVGIVRRYVDVVKAEFHVTKVILFGSYAAGNPRKHSDIDVAVVVEKLETDVLTAEFILHKLRRDIDYRIEPVLFLEGYDPAGFLEHVEETGVVVYSAIGVALGN
ncbi:MAG: nucleotidyltransferase domain-containing protein [Ignavibacteriae bacterium]|nr:nucleotidyltransferase domain-containing protein [Ignavibacteriota bacterium]